MSILRLPAASLRLAVAIRYWHSARIILSHQIRSSEFMEPVGHLLSMTAELSLKAFLLERGMAERELGKKNIGHDLGAILQKSIENGLDIYEEDAIHVLVLRTAHLEHFHRYGPKTFEGAYAIVLPKEEEALRALARIIDLIALDYKDLRHRHQGPEDLDWPRTIPPLKPITLGRFKRVAADVEEYARKVEAYGVPHAGA